MEKNKAGKGGSEERGKARVLALTVIREGPPRSRDLNERSWKSRQREESKSSKSQRQEPGQEWWGAQRGLWS